MADQDITSMEDTIRRKMTNAGSKAQEGTFKKDSRRTSQMGKKGARAQSTGDKAKGGMNGNTQS